MSKREIDPGYTDGIDYHGDDIVCPHCFEIDEEYSDYPYDLRCDGDKAQVSCAECGQDFTVSLCVEYTFMSRP